jgi:serine/threonine-protein kinase RsbW
VKALLRLRSDGAELRRVINFAQGFARRHALSSAETARLSIILEELFTNVVNYGYDANAPMGEIEIALALEAGRLKIEFSDDGRPFDPLIRPPPDLDQPEADRRIGGLGLHIVRSLVDDAQYIRDSERNHLVLTRKTARHD